LKRLLLAAFLLLAAAAQAETWRFALIGDTPYNAYERRELPIMLDKIVDEHPAFIVHAGDFKQGNAPCSDALFQDRYTLFNAVTKPFIYVPGDNEWTDCSRILAGGFEPLERLNKLREIFFIDQLSLGQTKLKVERQSAAYPEHQRWQLGPVLFLTLNSPGGNNNYGRSPAPSAEFMARHPRTLDWLRQGFAIARRDQLPAVVIIMQANPGFKHFAAGLAHSGFRELLETLRDETMNFPGQVLFVHGDTHSQHIDQPLRHPVTKQTMTNFTRVETFGYPFMGWIKVIIDTELPQLFRFEIHPHP
jgi:hypothetical protein